MEDIGDAVRRERYENFREAIKQRVHDIGVAKGSSIRRAQAVERRLFETFGGDASKVTDDGIVRAYDTIDES